MTGMNVFLEHLYLSIFHHSLPRWPCSRRAITSPLGPLPSQIPHYNLCEATEAVKPVLGSYYREPRKSGPIPFHLWDTFVASLKRDHYVPDQGDIGEWPGPGDIAATVLWGRWDRRDPSHGRRLGVACG